MTPSIQEEARDLVTHVLEYDDDREPEDFRGTRTLDGEEDEDDDEEEGSKGADDDATPPARRPRQRNPWRMEMPRNPTPEDRLFYGNCGLAVEIGNGYRIPGYSQQEIISHAMDGLQKAANSYEPQKGAFANYAGRIIRNELHDLRRYARSSGRDKVDYVLDEPLPGDEDSAGSTRGSSLTYADAQAGWDALQGRGGSGGGGEHLRPETLAIVRQFVSEMPQETLREFWAQKMMEVSRPNTDITDQIGLSPSRSAQLWRQGLAFLARRMQEEGFEGIDPKTVDLLGRPPKGAPARPSVKSATGAKVGESRGDTSAAGADRDDDDDGESTFHGIFHYLLLQLDAQVRDQTGD